MYDVQRMAGALTLASILGFLAAPVGAQDPSPLLLALDEDAVQSGQPPQFFSDIDVNKPIAAVGLRDQLRFFREHVGQRVTLPAGQPGDEGWFALTTVPSTWSTSDAGNDRLQDYWLAGPGLGSPDDSGNRGVLLASVPGVTPLRAAGLQMLTNHSVCAVVYAGDIAVDSTAHTAALDGVNLGIVAFRVTSVGASQGDALPWITVEIMDASQTCAGSLAALADAPDPMAATGSE